MTVDPVTGTSSVLVGGPTVDGYPAVSLDGTRVAFVRETDRGQMLYVVDTSGGDPLAADKGALSRRSTTPRGRRVADSIAFTRHATARTSNLWVAQTDGSEAHQGRTWFGPVGRPAAVAPARRRRAAVGRVDISPQLGFPPELWLPRRPSVPSRTRAVGHRPVRRPTGWQRACGRSRPPTGRTTTTVSLAWTPAGEPDPDADDGPWHGLQLKIRVLGADGELIRTIEPTSGVRDGQPNRVTRWTAGGLCRHDVGRELGYPRGTDRWVLGEPVETGASFAGNSGGLPLVA